MRNILQKNKAQMAMEVITVIVLVMAALLVFQKYIAQAMYGRWKGVGDSWSFGRQYDPNNTTECVFNVWGNDARWFESNCFETQCKLDCIGNTASAGACDTCLRGSCLASTIRVDNVDVCNKPITAP